MKSFSQVIKEIAKVNLKQDRRALSREKEMYSFWRNRKILAIEHARSCKKLGLGRLQLRWQLEAAKYDHLAKESKARIRKLGDSIYK